MRTGLQPVALPSELCRVAGQLELPGFVHLHEEARSFAGWCRNDNPLEMGFIAEHPMADPSGSAVCQTLTVLWRRDDG